MRLVRRENSYPFTACLAGTLAWKEPCFVTSYGTSPSSKSAQNKLSCTTELIWQARKHQGRCGRGDRCFTWSFMILRIASQVSKDFELPLCNQLTTPTRPTCFPRPTASEANQTSWIPSFSQTAFIIRTINDDFSRIAMMSVFDTGPRHFRSPSTISSNSNSPLRSLVKHTHSLVTKNGRRFRSRSFALEFPHQFLIHNAGRSW